ncbi:hypothetical protein [Polyangium fumosum]|uniref:4Fe-4S ferredoxin-type domain-containing protein n=1 Tax=Polyangium fumosum TaxID=889272 RepID=A0A4U1JB08_9BACT|nr:hypothetical protein [Polyangium fumosum]TKD06512.1 hypothetical protein E8A74_18520 [Polyangium fumosum]
MLNKSRIAAACLLFGIVLSTGCLMQSDPPLDSDEAANAALLPAASEMRMDEPEEARTPAASEAGPGDDDDTGKGCFDPVCYRDCQNSCLGCPGCQSECSAACWNFCC